MSDRSPAEKAHVKPGATVAVLNPVPGVVEAVGLPDGVTFVDPAEAQLVFLIVRDRDELRTMMPDAVSAMGPASALWVFFRKGSGAAGLDMSRNDVWAVAETLDLRPLGLVSVDETWTAFRLKRG